MDKIKTVKIKNIDGSISEESYTISVDARNVDMDNGKDLQDTIGEINLEQEGNIENQLKNKINKIDIVDNLESTFSTKVLSAKQGKILNEKNTETNNTFNKTISTHLTSLELNRIFRFLNKRNVRTDSDYDNTKSSATGIQGGVIISDTRLLTTTWDGNNQLENLNQIQEINLQTGEIVREREYNWGWANGLAYNPNQNIIYICPRGRCYSNGNQNLKELVIVSYLDFSVIDTITLDTDTPIQSVYYDTSKNELWVMGEGISKFYKISMDDYSILDTIDVNIPILNLNNNYYYQNFCIIDDLFYVLGSSPRALYIYNQDGNLVKQYTMPIYADELYTIGEYQWIQYRNNMLYIGDSMTVGTDIMMQIFQSDLKTGNIGLSRYGEGSYYNNSQLQIYIDASNTNVNPNGTSSNPFKTISEAGLVPQNNRGGISFYVANGTYGQAYLFNLHHPRISASNSNPDVTIAGGDFRYCDNMEIFDIKFIDSVKSDSPATINMTLCNLFLRRCNITHETSNRYGIYTHNSSIIVLDSETTFNAINNYYNVDIDQTSILMNQNENISFRKNGYNGLILGKAPQISAQDFSISYGDLPNMYMDFSSDKINYNNYSYIIINYTFKQCKKQIKCPMKNTTTACFSDSYINNQGDVFICKAYIGWNNTSKKISITGNYLVTVTNNNGTGVITRSSLDGSQPSDFENDNYILINNIGLE